MPGLRVEGALLDGGRAAGRANKAAAEAAQAEVGYLKAIVAAESELASAFAQLQAAEGRRTPSKAAVDYALERLAVTRLRLQAGTLARLDAIDAERSVFEAEDAQASARRSLIEASIAIHAALVGAGASQAP
jgi:outer membrane protein TolC